MAFEQKLPVWLAPGADPSEEAKNNGWGMGQHPPADWFNWQWNRTYLALKELQQKAASKDEISDVDLTPLETEINKLKQTTAAHQADDTSHVRYGVATGTANTYAVTLDPAPTNYTEGMAVSVKINVDATNMSTLNVNGLGSRYIKKANGDYVKNLKAGGIYTFRYSSATFILQGEGASGNALASDLLSGKTASTDAGDIVGTMPNNSSKKFDADVSEGSLPTLLNVKMRSSGFYDTNSTLVIRDSNLIPDNILSGKSIFGVSGTAIEGKRFQAGTTTSSSSSGVTVTGLPFKPSKVIIQIKDPVNYYVETAIISSTADIESPLSKGYGVYSYGSYNISTWGDSNTSISSSMITANGFNFNGTTSGYLKNKPAQWWAFE